MHKGIFLQFCKKGKLGVFFYFIPNDLVLFYFAINCMYPNVIEILPGFEVITAANVFEKIKSFLSEWFLLHTVQDTLILQDRRNFFFFLNKNLKRLSRK